MPVKPEKDDESLFRPVWEIDDEDEPPGPPRKRKAPKEPDYDHPLLTPLARAQEAVARLEAKMETASESVVAGLRARMSYLEAAGWLRYAHFGIHPWDLALRDKGLTTSLGAAARGGQLASVLPSTVTPGSEPDLAPSVIIRLDIEVDQALRLARLWRRLAEMRSFRPLASVAALRDTLRSLGCSRPEDSEIADWLASLHLFEREPVLIGAGRAARDWTNLAGVDERNPDGIFVGACFWAARGRPIALPFWSAPEQRHMRLGLQFGLAWMTEFLECVREAALGGLRELERLRNSEEKGRLLGATARSRLPDAFDALVREPVVTRTSLAKTLHVTPRAALKLLQHLVAEGVVREATGRASWRAYVLKA
jgi:hypothetical protein